MKKILSFIIVSIMIIHVLPVSLLSASGLNTDTAIIYENPQSDGADKTAVTSPDEIAHIPADIPNDAPTDTPDDDPMDISVDELTDEPGEEPVLNPDIDPIAPESEIMGTLSAMEENTMVTAIEDLQDAIDIAEDGAILELTFSDGTLPYKLEIDKNITLRSASTLTLYPYFQSSPSANNRHIHATGTDVTITFENIILDGGYTSGTSVGSLGGIFNDAASLTLVNPIIKNCYNSMGGAILTNENCRLFIQGDETLIQGNTASNGGGIYVHTYLSVTGGEISENTGINGGGINGFAGSGSCEIHIDGTKVLNNRAEPSGPGQNNGMGGGIYIDPEQKLYISNGIITGNTANYGGGIMLHNNSEAYISKSQINSNAVWRSGIEYGCTGGGISLYPGAYVELTDTEINLNRAETNGESGGSGGGVYLFSTASLKMSGGEIKGNTVKREEGRGGLGGGIYASADTGLSFLKGAEISENIAEQGGGIYMSSGTINLDSAVMSGNAAVSLGGAIISGGSVTFTDGEITDNTAGYGGGIYSPTDDSTVTIAGAANISGNTAEGNGGGIFMAQRYNLEVGEKVIFKENSASKGYIWNVDLMETNSADNASGTHNINIKGSKFSFPFKNAFNNFDVNYPEGMEYKNEFYTVEYHPNGGTGSRESIKEPVGYVHTVLDNSNENLGYSRDNYRFLGWAEDKNAVSAGYIEGDIIGLTAEEDTLIVLYAVWQALDIDSYTVTYDPNGGTGGIYTVKEIMGSNHTVLENSHIRLGYIRDNYTFIGWSKERNANKADYTGGELLGIDVPKDTVITLFAVWQAKSSSGGGSSDRGGASYILTYYANNSLGETPVKVSGLEAGDRVIVKNGDIFTPPEGYTFAGWSDSAKGKVLYQPGDVFFMPRRNVDLYAIWEKNRPNLDKENHFAYIAGYPEGDVRPQNNMTRAEAAAIFFRLLTGESRQLYLVKENNYGDVDKSHWANTEISTLSNAGILFGYKDGTYRPSENITRAEFASLAARLPDVDFNNSIHFSDISGHWAENAIKTAAQSGYIEGYTDGSFHPDNYISRAEVISLLNRVLERHVDEEGLLQIDMIQWSDNLDTGAWYYYDIQEATNSHNYEKDESRGEIWTEITPSLNWDL